MQTDSEYESDVSSITDSSTTDRNQPSCEHLVKRVDSLTQENRVLQIELQTYRLRLKASQQEIKQLKQFVDDRFFFPSLENDFFLFFLVKV
jgi:coiled-coil domain-containing protein 6